MLESICQLSKYEVVATWSREMSITEGVQTETGCSSVRDPIKEAIVEYTGRWMGLSLNPFWFSLCILYKVITFTHVAPSISIGHPASRLDLEHAEESAPSTGPLILYCTWSFLIHVCSCPRRMVAKNGQRCKSLLLPFGRICKLDH